MFVIGIVTSLYVFSRSMPNLDSIPGPGSPIGLELGRYQVQLFDWKISISPLWFTLGSAPSQIQTLADSAFFLFFFRTELVPKNRVRFWVPCGIRGAKESGTVHPVAIHWFVILSLLFRTRTILSLWFECGCPVKILDTGDRYANVILNKK